MLGLIGEESIKVGNIYGKKTRGIITLCVKYHPKSDREQINEHFQQRLSSY